MAVGVVVVEEEEEGGGGAFQSCALIVAPQKTHHYTRTVHIHTCGIGSGSIDKCIGGNGGDWNTLALWSIEVEREKLERNKTKIGTSLYTRKWW